MAIKIIKKAPDKKAVSYTHLDVYKRQVFYLLMVNEYVLKRCHPLSISSN